MSSGVSFQRILTEIGLWSLVVVAVLVAGVVAFEVRRRRREKRRIDAELTVIEVGDGDEPAASGTDGTTTRDHPASDISPPGSPTHDSSTAGPTTHVDGPPPPHEADTGPMVT